MAGLLQATPLDKQFGYRVRKGVDIYMAEAKGCCLSDGKAIWGTLSLDKLSEVDVRIWTPRLINPFATQMGKKEKRNSELSIPRIMIAHSGWEKGESLDDFAENVKDGVLQEYQAKFSSRDVKHFFGQVHEHYMNFF